MPPPSESATIETDVFEHSVIKSDFINTCCFGEDFATWLRARLEPLVAEFTLGAPIMEDYGWGFWANHARGNIWIALSYAHDEPVEGPATWVISVDWQDPHPIKRWFRKPDRTLFRCIADAVWAAVRAEPRIRLIEFGG